MAARRTTKPAEPIVDEASGRSVFARSCADFAADVTLVLDDLTAGVEALRAAHLAVLNGASPDPADARAAMHLHRVMASVEALGHSAGNTRTSMVALTADTA